MAVRAGRLKESVVTVIGKPRITDFALADREWEASTLHERRPVSTDRTSAAPPAEEQPTGAPGAAANEPAEGSAIDYRAQQTRLTTAKADREELELAREMGRLVDADAAARAKVAENVLARSKLLGVPSKLKAQYPQLEHQVIAAVDALIRQALEEIADTRPEEGAA